MFRQIRRSLVLLHLHLLLLLNFLCSSAVAQDGYGAYAGLPVEGVNGAGIAGNGADADRDGVAHGATIRKAPIAPVAPPRIPLPLPFGDIDEIPAHRQSIPPPTRRDVRSEGQCQFDPTKWRLHAQSAAANAIMFDRTSGLSCDECLQLCISKYQDPSSGWICRSVTYDHRWKICDLFAVNGSGSPYFLVDYKGRDYFDYLAALPPTDNQLKGQNSPAETGDNNLNINNKNNGEEENNLVVQRDAEGQPQQCLCPCKLLSDKIAQNGPLGGVNGTADKAGGGNYSASVSAAEYSGLGGVEGEAEQVNVAELDGFEQQKRSSSEPLPLAPDEGAAVPSTFSALPESGSASPPVPESASPVPLDQSSASFTASPPPSLPQFAAVDMPVGNATPNAEGGGVSEEPSPEAQSQTSTPTTESSAAPGPQPSTIQQPTPGSSPSSVPFSLPSDDANTLIPFSSSSASSSSSDGTSSPPPPHSSSSSPQISISSEDDSSLLLTSSSSSPSPPPSLDPTSSSPATSPPSNASASETGSDGHRALSSKTYQQPFREIRVPFHKTLAKMNRMASAALKQRPSRMHEMPRACTKKGQMAHYVEVADHQRLLPPRKAGAGTTEEIGAKDATECMDACDAPIRLATCNSAVFSAAHRCELFTSAANHSAPDSLLAAPKFKYMEKICMDASLSRGDKRNIFTAVIGHILVGHVQEVFNAGSLSECIKACLLAESNYGFVCKSVMFYPTDSDQNCLMNSESRRTQADVFVQEDPNVHMLYVDMEQPRVPPSPLPLAEDEERRFKDIPMVTTFKKRTDDEAAGEQSRWTRWSMCLNSSSTPETAEMRHRYMKCREAKDVRKCPKESFPCKKVTKTLRIERIKTDTNETDEGGRGIGTEMGTEKEGAKTSECLAVRDARGLKRCPYGMRWNGSQREFCSKPIDC